MTKGGEEEEEEEETGSRGGSRKEWGEGNEGVQRRIEWEMLDCECWKIPEVLSEEGGGGRGAGEVTSAETADMNLRGWQEGDKRTQEGAVMSGGANGRDWKWRNKRRHGGMKESDTARTPWLQFRTLVALPVLRYLCKL